MRRHYLIILSLICAFALQAQEYQLSKPLIRVQDNGFFFKKAKVTLDFRIEGAVLRYTYDGKEPTKKSKKYKSSLSFKKSGLLKIKAYKKGFIPSETVSIRLNRVKSLHGNVAIKINPEPQPPYAGNALAHTLIDFKGGSTNFHDGNWLGYNSGPIEITLKIPPSNKVKELVISSLNSPDSWIFPPTLIQLASSDDDKEFVELENRVIPELGKDNKSDKAYYSFKLKGDLNSFIRITIHPLKKLPEWHPGKGNAAWVFLDEIIIN